jgi:RNA polymerase sigma-70 factor (ECF subfamily)
MSRACLLGFAQTPYFFSPAVHEIACANGCIDEGAERPSLEDSSGAEAEGECCLGIDTCDYESLVRPIEDRMIRSVWRIVRDPDDADDAFQEAVATVWKRLARIRRHPNPHALILRICTNAAYDVLRRRTRLHKRLGREEDVVELPDPAPSAAERLSSGETQAEIMQAVGQLPPKQAAAVLMRFVQNLSYGDIAQSLNCTEATVRKHIARARVKLRRLLEHLAPTSLAPNPGKAVIE